MMRHIGTENRNGMIVKVAVTADGTNNEWDAARDLLETETRIAAETASNDVF